MKQLVDIEKVKKSRLDIFLLLCRMSFTIFCLFLSIVSLIAKKTSVQNSNCEFHLISSP